MRKDEVYDEHTGVSHGSYRTYIIGFISSVLLTILVFFCVGFKVFDSVLLYIIVIVLALLQFYIQLVYFLHLDIRPNNYWNFTSFIFTMIIVFILVLGTLWIMFDLYTMMMIM